MNDRSLRLLWILAGSLALAGCDRNNNPGSECKGYLAGDLVITEFMSDPSGTDTGKEWFEFYNATSKEVTLRGFTVYLAKTDGSSAKSYVLTAGKLAKGGYWVVGDAEAATKPTWVNESYGTKLGGIGNTEGLIGIKCGTIVVDEVKYTTAGTSGHSHTLNGRLVPDSAGNDKETNWCDGTTDMGNGEFGTPGAANDTCVSSTSCTDATTQTSRDVVPPGVGDVVISEFMADPTAVGDDLGEWIELYAAAPVDLNGLTVWIGTSKSTIASDTCLHLDAGQYALLAHSTDPAQNGGLPTVTATFTPSLPNTAGTIALKSGDTVIDQTSYPTTVSGAAAQLDLTKLDAASNDDPNNWCPATATYGTGGDMGTPGAANIACPVVVPSDSCVDASGATRKIVVAAPGDLVISEFMADPTAVGDTVGEWIEVWAKNAVDLNNLEFSCGSSKTVLTSAACIPVAAQGYALLAHSTDPSINGGLPTPAALFSFSLPNTTGTITIKSGTTVIDSTSYSKVTAGAAAQLDVTKLDAALNDDPNNFCPATATYGAAGTAGTDKGTPGAANATCPVVVPSDSCVDSTGATRKIVVPALGDLVISEFMPDPTVVADTVGEWIEVWAKNAVDLNNLEFSSGTSKTLLTSTPCLSVPAQGYAVLAHGSDPAINGGLPTPIALFSFSLPNTSGTIAIKSGTTVIDTVSYTKVTSGAATQLDVAKLDATLNDDPNNFCPATTTYGTAAKDKGTPGAANIVCGQVVDPNKCKDAASGLQRDIVPPAVGDLVISEYLADPTGTDTDKEWLEFNVKTDVDLNGVEFSVGSTKVPIVTSADCVRPGAGTFQLLAQSSVPGTNGGLPVPLAIFSATLTNSGGQVYMLSRAGTTIDTVTALAAKSGGGYSKQLSSAGDGKWCDAAATATYGTNGDHGTPAAANGACP